MKNNFTQKEFKEISMLVNNAISASDKTEAQKYITRLNFIGNDLQGYPNCIFGELVASTTAASGRVADKERQINFVKENLIKLEMLINRHNSSEEI